MQFPVIELLKLFTWEMEGIGVGYTCVVRQGFAGMQHRNWYSRPLHSLTIS